MQIRSLACRSAVASLLLSLAGAAAADTSPYRLGISQSVMHDDNLLRVGDGQVLPEGYSRSDTVYSTALIAGIDQPISRQRLFGDATLRVNRYARNKVYDDESYNLRLGLDWATIGRLGGNLLATSNRTLASFAGAEDGVPTERNIERSTRYGATVYYGLVSLLRAEANIERSEVNYSSERYRRREFEQTGASLGLRWRPSGALNLLFAVRRTTGSYPNYLVLADGSTTSDDFRRLALEVSGDWVASSASRLRARFSQGRTRYDIARERDFSGLTGEISWAWQPTGKLALTTKLQREPGQDSYLLGTTGDAGAAEFSRMTTALDLQANYQLSAKILLQAGYTYSHRDLERTLSLTNVGQNSVATRDHGNAFKLGATWQPQRSLSLGCDWRRTTRSASDLYLAQRSNAFSCFGQFMLQ